MIIRETDNLCNQCTRKLAQGCYGEDCPYIHELVMETRICDNCKEPVEDFAEGYYIVDGQELCEECAFEWFFSQDNKKVFEEALRYIDHDKQLQVDFYLNWVCDSDIWHDREKVSDKVIEIVKKECVEFPNMLYEDLKGFCAEDKDDFVSFFYERETV